MDVFTPISSTITTFSCRYCGGSHKGKSGREIHLKTQKHKDAVQKHKDKETLLALKEEFDDNTDTIDYFKRDNARRIEKYMKKNEEIQRQILEIALKQN